MKPPFKVIVAGALRTALIILFLVISAHSQELPLKPEPFAEKASWTIARESPRKPKAVADKAFWIVSGAMAGAYIADMTSTAGWIHRCSECFEEGWFDHHGRSLPKIAAGVAAWDISVLLASYEWKKHIHNRILNRLWIIAPSLQIANHIQGVVLNNSLGRN
jgi:hypothetical protein